MGLGVDPAGRRSAWPRAVREPRERQWGEGETAWDKAWGVAIHRQERRTAGSRSGLLEMSWNEHRLYRRPEETQGLTAHGGRGCEEMDGFRIYSGKSMDGS